MDGHQEFTVCGEVNADLKDKLFRSGVIPRPAHEIEALFGRGQRRPPSAIGSASTSAQPQQPAAAFPGALLTPWLQSGGTALLPLAQAPGDGSWGSQLGQPAADADAACLMPLERAVLPPPPLPLPAAVPAPAQTPGAGEPAQPEHKQPAPPPRPADREQLLPLPRPAESEQPLHRPWQQLAPLFSPGKSEERALLPPRPPALAAAPPALAAAPPALPPQEPPPQPCASAAGQRPDAAVRLAQLRAQLEALRLEAERLELFEAREPAPAAARPRQPPSALDLSSAEAADLCSFKLTTGTRNVNPELLPYAAHILAAGLGFTVTPHLRALVLTIRARLPDLSRLLGSISQLRRYVLGLRVQSPQPATADDGDSYVAAVDAFESAAAAGVPASAPSFCLTMAPGVTGNSWPNRVSMVVHICEAPRHTADKLAPLRARHAEIFRSGVSVQCVQDALSGPYGFEVLYAEAAGAEDSTDFLALAWQALPPAATM